MSKAPNGNLVKKAIKYPTSIKVLEFSMSDLNKAYVSPHDRFFYEFYETHEKTPSQIKEIEKHQRIAKMRDDKDYEEHQGRIWEGF